MRSSRARILLDPVTEAPRPAFIWDWENTTNATVSTTDSTRLFENNKLKKTGGANNTFTDCNPRTTTEIPAGPFSITFKMPLEKSAFIGLAIPGATSNGFADLVHAFWHNSGEVGVGYCYEDGNSVASSPEYVPGQSLTIERDDDDDVRYYMDGEFIFLSMDPTSGPLIVKACLADTDAEAQIDDLEY